MTWCRPGSGVGSVLRAEVETTLDGTTVIALLPSKVKTEGRKAERIEVLGTPTRGPDVNVVLAGKPCANGTALPTVVARPVADRRRTGHGATAPANGPTRHARTRPKPPGAAARVVHGAGARAALPDRDGPRRSPRRARTGTPPWPRCGPEQLPVAEQLLRGGIPAVRHAIEEQNSRARADGRPEVTPEPLLAMAEQLLPVINLAAWKDRAAAARAAGRDVPLRELRSIVAAGSTVTLDEEGTEMASALRTSLDERVTALRDRWVERITSALDAGRVVDAVRASIRPPEPAARLSAELAVRLADAAGQAMSVDTPPADWAALLEVVVDSPVRRTVKPQGLPAGADEALLAAARKASGYVPELARLMGIPIPPPPGPRRPVPARSVSGPARLLTVTPARSSSGGRPVHGEHPGLEPGRLEEVLRLAVAGEGGAVDPGHTPLLEPGECRLEQPVPETHTPASGST